MEALIDSGSDSNLLDTDFVREAELPTTEIDPPLAVNALNGNLLTHITHQTELLPLLVAGNHRESIAFHVISSTHAPLVLGLPWLQLHNPVLDWAAGRIVSK